MKKESKEEALEKNIKTSFRENLEQSKLKLALLKENFEYQDFFTEFLEWDKKTRNKGGRVWPNGIFNGFGLVRLRFFIAHPQYRKIIDLINPKNDISVCSNNLVANVLPRLFYDHAVELIEVGKITHLDEGGLLKRIRVVNEGGLEPWERIYKVDLSKKKAQIMKEFEGYLDRAYLSNTEESNWIPNNKRGRKEAWTHLEVWKLRKKRKSFSEIAKTLNITTEAAKKSFYRAYELTQWKRYDPETLKKEIWSVKIADIKITCDICPERGECKELCPDVLRYVEQDNTPLREKTLSEYSDSLRDYLIHRFSRSFNRHFGIRF